MDVRHILNNMLFSGFAKVTVPLKWQILDIVYLILDVIVLVGLHVATLILVVAILWARRRNA